MQKTTKRIKRCTTVLLLTGAMMMCSNININPPEKAAPKIKKEVSHKTMYTTQPDISVEEVKITEYQNRWGITEMDEDTMNLLAKLVYLEGNITGLQGCQQVVVVIFNRFVDGRFFGKQDPSIKSVLSAPGQFGPYWRAANDPNVVATEQEYEAIRTVLNGDIEGNVDDAIYNGQWLYFNGDGHRNYFW